MGPGVPKASLSFRQPFLSFPCGSWVKNGVTPKWVALVNGTHDENLRSNSWLNFDPHPFGSWPGDRPMAEASLQRLRALHALCVPRGGAPRALGPSGLGPRASGAEGRLFGVKGVGAPERRVSGFHF